MRGFYRFTQDDRVIESENIITDDGKLLIARYLAGLIDSYSGAIAVGIGTTPATTSDKTLVYEFARSPILVRNVVGPTADDLFQVSFKSVLPIGLEGVIRESAIISQVFNRYSGAYGDRLLAKFSSPELWDTTSSNNMAAVNQTFAGLGSNVDSIRIGGEAVYVTTSNASSANIEVQSTTVQGDFSGYSSADQFAFAYSSPYTSSGTSIQVKFYTDASNYWFYTFSPTVTTSGSVWTYSIAKFTKANFSQSGSPSWDNITKAGVVVSTNNVNTRMALDGLSMFDTDYINPDYAMTSRTVTSTPVIKYAGKSMDVEYFLEFKL